MIVLDNDVAVKLLRDGDDAIERHLSQYSKEVWAIPTLVSYEFYRHYDSFEVVTDTKRRLESVFDEILPLTLGRQHDADRQLDRHRLETRQLMSADLLGPLCDALSSNRQRWEVLPRRF